jgi:class 3 adenylate cyclase
VSAARRDSVQPSRMVRQVERACRCGVNANLGNTSAELPPATLVVDPGTPAERDVAIYDRLFVGRECAGVDESRRLLIDDPSASRNHLEIRVDRDQGVAYVIDMSTNGTRLNGIRVERGVPVMLAAGDVLAVGIVRLEFRSDSLRGNDSHSLRATTALVTNAEFVMVVGDIVGFSTSSHGTPNRLVMQSLEMLLREFRALLSKYKGTLSNFVGDAFFAIWELGFDERTPQLAFDFVIDAVHAVEKLAPTLPLRSVDGGPLRMGWGVAHGDAAISTMMGVLLNIVGDATTLAFRLSEIAARNGRSEVLVTDAFYSEVAELYPFEDVGYVHLKGRPDPELVHGLRLPRVV